MTIQRLYSLPNCKLVLEGLSGDGPTGQADIRPVLSILMSAECHFEGKGQPLSGGREFFESLVRAVSSYAQEFLSGVPSPLNQNTQAALVHLRKIHADLHRLTFEDKTEAKGETSTETEAKIPLGRSIDLTTVQLFDLVEAVDQFFADPQTLPDLSLNLRPLSKKEVISTEPIAKRVLPAGIGVSSFALAAIAFFFVPIPEVKRPVETTTEESSSNIETSPISNLEEPKIEPSPETIPVENFSASLETPPKITQPDKIQELRQQLYDKINSGWKNSVDSDLIYRVEVREDGTITGYQPINPQSADDVDRTPLPELRYKTIESETNQEPIAEFKVEFTRNGALQVNSW